MSRIFIVIVITLSIAASPTQARKPAKKPDAAETVPPPAMEPEAEAAAVAAKQWWPPTASVGPAKVDLAGQASFDVPEGYVYLGKKDSQAVMERLGNKPSDTDVGAIIPQDLDANSYFVTVDWAAEGYVKDDEADKLDAKEILESIKEGNEAANEYRKEHGFPPVEVVGWGEPPRYERSAHHIVWAIIGKSERSETVNFNTRLLGREGYLSLNLICGPEQLAALKPTMADLLKRAQFTTGKRYVDFQSGKDKVAEYGLAAMVIGGAALAGKAVKIGLLAKFGKVLLALLIAGKKAIVLLLVGIGAFLRRLFRRKKQDDGLAAATAATGQAGPAEGSAAADPALAPPADAAPKADDPPQNG